MTMKNNTIQAMRKILDKARGEAARAIRGETITITFRGFNASGDVIWAIHANDGTWFGKYVAAKLATHVATLVDFGRADGSPPARVLLAPTEWQAMMKREREEGAR